MVGVPKALDYFLPVAGCTPGGRFPEAGSSSVSRPCPNVGHTPRLKLAYSYSS